MNNAMIGRQSAPSPTFGYNSAGNLLALTGSATYSSPAFGVFVDRQAGVAVFDATAELAADFGQTGIGTIEGTVDNFTDETATAIPGNPVLMLESTAIGNNFQSGTSGTYNGEAYAGKWGGQFHGNGNSATDHPGSVAGTFGATTADGTNALVGAFGAYKQ